MVDDEKRAQFYEFTDKILAKNAFFYSINI